MKRYSCPSDCCEYQSVYYNRKKNPIRFWEKRMEKPQKAGIFITTPYQFSQGASINSGLVEKEITDSDYSKENIEGIITEKDLNDVKILLVQSKGQFWGPPKGSLNPGESIINAAIREVKEETGIEFDQKNIGEIRVVKGSCYYFHLNIDEIPVSIQTSLEGNDANGIGWFRVECLNNMVKSGKLQINQHCTLLIKKILGYTISQNTPIQRSAKISFVKI